MTFTEWMEKRLGTRKWVVARRWSVHLRDKGYDLRLAPKRYTELRQQFKAEGHHYPGDDHA